MMSERRRIDRASGSAAPKEVPAERARQARHAAPQPVPPPSDEFLSESEIAPRGVVVSSARLRKRRFANGPDAFLTDAEAFLSEVSACASDRPTKLVVVESFPAETTSFSSELDDPAGLESLPLIGASRETPAVLSDAMLPVPKKGHDRLAKAVTLTALSASFFVAVVLLTEALDWTHRTMFINRATVAVAQPTVAPAVVAEPEPAIVAPILELTPSVAPQPPVDIAPAAPVDRPASPPSPVIASTAPVAAAAESGDRSVELAPQALIARAAPVETVLLATEPIRLEPPSASPAAPVARVMPERVEPAPAPPAVPSEADQIDGVLTRYRGAFNALDSAAARGVWPSVDERALDRAFARLEQQEVAFERCDIDVAGERAAATCTGSARYVPKVGSRTQQTSSREWRFNLQKVEDRWVIEAVDAR